MNIYRRIFTRLCPVNGIEITYHLEITTDKMIMAENILRATEHDGVDYHEKLADRLADRLGGHQVLRAMHHGVEIETVRGAS